MGGNSYAAADEDRPLAGYVALMGAYAVSAAALALGARRKPERRLGAFDLAVVALATHKLSRLITKDSISSALRAPLVRYVEPAGGGEVNEEVRVDGALHALGELVICPVCIDVWVATAFVGGFVFAPRLTRAAASVLSVIALSNAAHYGWDALKQSAE